MSETSRSGGIRKARVSGVRFLAVAQRLLTVAVGFKPTGGRETRAASRQRRLNPDSEVQPRIAQMTRIRNNLREANRETFLPARNAIVLFSSVSSVVFYLRVRIKTDPISRLASRISTAVVPEGTAEARDRNPGFCRPSGTRFPSRLNPALKRWVILTMSLRDKGTGHRIPTPPIPYPARAAD